MTWRSLPCPQQPQCGTTAYLTHWSSGLTQWFNQGSTSRTLDRSCLDKEPGGFKTQCLIGKTCSCRYHREGKERAVVVISSAGGVYKGEGCDPVQDFLNPYLRLQSHVQFTFNTYIDVKASVPDDGVWEVWGDLHPGNSGQGEERESGMDCEGSQEGCSPSESTLESHFPFSVATILLKILKTKQRYVATFSLSQSYFHLYT